MEKGALEKVIFRKTDRRRGTTRNKPVPLPWFLWGNGEKRIRESAPKSGKKIENRLGSRVEAGEKRGTPYL